MAFGNLPAIVCRLQRHVLYDAKGIFSKSVVLPYKTQFRKPWAVFECQSDPRYSFVAHELRFGHDGNPEGPFWHEKEAELHGYISRLYPYLGTLRGHMTETSTGHELAVQVYAREARECLTHDAIDAARLADVDLMITAAYIAVKQEIDERTMLEDAQSITRAPGE